jgi:hypothetical protein
VKNLLCSRRKRHEGPVHRRPARGSSGDDATFGARASTAILARKHVQINR